jgi:hypothetical protein
VSCALALFVAAPAGADEYCAGTTGCAADHSYAGDGPGLQGALSAAQANPGADAVHIGAGRFTTADGFAYGSADPVEVSGAGIGQSVLDAPCNSPTFLMTGNTASGLGGVTLQGGSGPCQPAFSGAGRLHDLTVTGAWTSNAAISLSGGTVERVTVDAGTSGSGDGIATTGATWVTRTRILASGTGLTATSGASNVEDTLIRTTSGSSRGLFVAASGTADTALHAAHLTIVGEGTASGGDAGVHARATDNRRATLDLDHSIIRGYNASARAGADSGAHAVITISASDFDFASRALTGIGNRQIADGASNRDAASDPGFVDMAGHDYRLRFSSPDIDRSALPLIVGLDLTTTDLAGALRSADGIAPFDGPKRDFGAFEYQGHAPAASATAPTTATVGKALTFAGSGSDSDPGETIVRYSWKFDDGTVATGAGATKAFATAGVHTGVLTVEDSTGRIASATATVAVAPPPGADRRGPDRTAPAFTSVRVADGALRYALTEPANVQIAIQPGQPGRRVGGRCVPALPVYRRRPACDRFETGASLARNGATGSVPLRGRLGDLRLTRGTYRATLRAMDAVGNTSVLKQLIFTIR